MISYTDHAETFEDSITIEYKYDERNNVIRRNEIDRSKKENNFMSYSNEYDTDGNILKETRQSKKFTVTFVYEGYLAFDNFKLMSKKASPMNPTTFSYIVD